MSESQQKSIFQTLQYQAFRGGLKSRTEKARTWFRDKIKQMGTIDRDQLLKDEALSPVTTPLVGTMFMYVYDPKHKATLPYYDKFPLIFLTDMTNDGWYGINLHYLAVPMRARLFDALLDTASNKKFDDNTKLKLNYGILNSTKKFKEFQPCFKRYLASHVKSKIVEVKAPEWEIAVLLPTHDFEKKTAQYVWTRSTMGKYL